MSAFALRMGIPEMEDYWNDLSGRASTNRLDEEEKRHFKKLVKTLSHLSANPRHPGLETHEISDLSLYGVSIHPRPKAGGYWLRSGLCGGKLVR